MKSQCHTGMKLAPVRVFACKHPLSPSVLPQVLVTRTTRSNSNRNVTHFISKKCNTVTFQRSFFNRTIRIWNTLANHLQLSCNLQISQFKSIMYKYYVDTLEHNYDPEDPRSWKTICPSCNVSHNVCPSSLFLIVTCSSCSLSGTTVIGLPLLWYPCLIKHVLFFVSVYIYSFIFLYHVIGEANKIK